jgi:hypothetical protein
MDKQIDLLRALLAEWADPPADMVDVIPKGGVELKYLGHAATTRALLECDPLWWWEPMSFDEIGQPLLVTTIRAGPRACGFTCTCAVFAGRGMAHASRARVTR